MRTPRGRIAGWRQLSNTELRGPTFAGRSLHRGPFRKPNSIALGSGSTARLPPPGARDRPFWPAGGRVAWQRERRGTDLEATTRPRTGIPASELASGAAGSSSTEQPKASAATSSSTSTTSQYFTGFGFLSTERPVVFAAERRWRDGRVRARVRGRAGARRDRRSSASRPTRSTRDSSTRCGSSRGCSPTSGSGHDRSRPGRLPRHPRLPGAGAQRGLRESASSRLRRRSRA